MIGFMRAAFFGLIGLSVIYVLVSIYSRSIRRETLEKEWDGDPLHEGLPPDQRDAYIEAGMEAYRHGLRRKLIVLVYVVPAVLFAATIYMMNWQ